MVSYVRGREYRIKIRLAGVACGGYDGKLDWCISLRHHTYDMTRIAFLLSAALLRADTGGDRLVDSALYLHTGKFAAVE